MRRGARGDVDLQASLVMDLGRHRLDPGDGERVGALDAGDADADGADGGLAHRVGEAEEVLGIEEVTLQGGEGGEHERRLGDVTAQVLVGR